MNDSTNNLPETNLQTKQEMPPVVGQVNGSSSKTVWFWVFGILVVLVLLLAVLLLIPKETLQRLLNKAGQTQSNSSGTVTDVDFSVLPQSFPPELNVEPAPAKVTKNQNIISDESIKAVREYVSMYSAADGFKLISDNLNANGWQVTPDSGTGNTHMGLSARKGNRIINVSVSPADTITQSVVKMTVTTTGYK